MEKSKIRTPIGFLKSQKNQAEMQLPHLLKISKHFVAMSVVFQILKTLPTLERMANCKQQALRMSSAASHSSNPAHVRTLVHCCW